MSLPTIALAVAISSDKRNAFVLHLMDTDASVPGWADECVKRALYTENKLFFLREMIKKGIKPSVQGEDFFRVASVVDESGESARLLLKAGYCPDQTVMEILANSLGKGVLGQTPAIIAALPKEKREDALAKACARGVLGSLPVDDLHRLNKMWKGKPPADRITQMTWQEAFHAKRPLGEIAEIMEGMGWLDTRLVLEAADHPLVRALQVRADHAHLNKAAASPSPKQRATRL